MTRGDILSSVPGCFISSFSTMTAKTLEKVPVNLGGFVDSVYTVDDIPAVAIFPSSDLGAHYDQMNVTAGKSR